MDILAKPEIKKITIFQTVVHFIFLQTHMGRKISSFRTIQLIFVQAGQQFLFEDKKYM